MLAPRAARVPRSARRAQHEAQVYGWSSLEAILRAEGSFGESPDELFAAIFTLGAVGSYISNLPFGPV